MGHPVYESMAAFLADVSRRLHHHYHSEKFVDRDDGKLRPPSPASRVLEKARAVLVLLYIAAKKKCTGSKNGKHTEPAGGDPIGHGKSFHPSPVRRTLGKARAVVVIAFHSAKKKLDVRAKEGGEEGIKESPEAVAGSKSVSGSKMLSTLPTSTPVRRALGKARAVVVSPFHAAKKRADDRKEKPEHAEDGPSHASESMSAGNGDTLSQSPRHSPLGAVRAVVIYPFLHARKKKKHATAAAEDEDTTVAFEETVEEAEHDRAWASPGTTHSTPSSLGTKSSKATPTRSPKALFRKVRAATVLLPFHSRKKASDSEQPAEEALPTEEGSSVEGGVWKKTILMGQKCEPLDFPGVIYYDSKGERLDGVPPRSPMSMVQQQLANSVPEQQHQQQNGFSFPVIIAGSGVNDRDFETER